MKVYIVGYCSKLYDSANEILCVYQNREDASKKVSELTHEAYDINEKINNCDAEEAEELLYKYTDKYGIDPYEIVFYFTETDLF